MKQVKDPNTKNWHTLAERSQTEVKGGDNESFSYSDTILQIEGEGLLEKD